ncbi:MAG: hypothetical protein ACTSRP_14625 [Candidatus Helarchaeota archaeon]
MFFLNVYPETKEYYKDLSNKIIEVKTQNNPNELFNIKAKSNVKWFKKMKDEIMEKIQNIKEYLENHFIRPKEKVRILHNLTEKIDVFDKDPTKFLNCLYIKKRKYRLF